MNYLNINELLENHNPISINKINPNLPLNIEVVHDELIKSIKDKKEMNLIIKIKSDKKIFCEAIDKKNEKCDIEAKYIHINNNKNIYNNNKSHMPLCWFCGLHLLKKISDNKD
jgi:hypothetical protein